MKLYADENFPRPVVLQLRHWGHNVVTVQDEALQGTPDPGVLARAHSLGRSVLTHNRRHFERLDRQGLDHSGIVSATRDNNVLALATRIHAALAGLSPGRWCIRVNRVP